MTVDVADHCVATGLRVQRPESCRAGRYVLDFASFIALILDNAIVGGVPGQAGIARDQEGHTPGLDAGVIEGNA